jgi:hypothetical protein
MTVHQRPWTDEEMWKLQDLIDQGYGYRDIAQRMQRSPKAIQTRAKRCAYRPLKAPHILTAIEVARVLGIPYMQTVRLWIRNGWLKARDARNPSKKPIWRIQQSDLTKFLGNEKYWFAWQPETVTDSALREWAEEARQGKPRWLTVKEVAARYCVSTWAVCKWIREQGLPATRYGKYYVWEPDLTAWRPSPKSIAYRG